MLIELVRAAAQVPELPLVIAPDRTLSYSDCLLRAGQVAAGLHAERIERLGCALAAPEDIVVALVGASACGSEACLYPRDLEREEIERFAARFDHHVVLADKPFELDHAQVVTLDQLKQTGGASPPATESSPVLILTTGTTAEPKGARHEWSRLARAVRHPDGRPGTRWLLVYNLNQFAGVQVLLHVLAGAGTLVQPASRRAEDAIAAIGAHRVTHVSATPTFWRLLAGRLDRQSAAELPLEQITLGGEAAPEGLIERLRDLLPGVRISHVYAGTEFGSAVSVRDGRAGLPVSVLERGADADVQFRIVDGELQLRSRIGMLGYHDGAQDGDRWRPTGDLVEIRDDRIQFVGRTSEIINVGGAKVHPLPVEELVCSVDGVQIAAAYGRPNAVTGQIVAVDAVAAPGTDSQQLEREIRDACQSLPPAARPRRIRLVPELRVHGNKLMRGEV